MQVTESGLDYFIARMNSGNLGRFWSPDPGNASGFLYPDDPQSWSGYAYARNNPLTLIDPTGEAFQYCQSDKDGKAINCENATDKQHEKDVQEGVNTFKDGKIYDGDKVIGTYKDLGPDLPGDPEANRQAAAMIVQTFNSATKEFAINAVLAGTGALAVQGIRAVALQTTIHGAERAAAASRLGKLASQITKLRATQKLAQADGACSLVVTPNLPGESSSQELFCHAKCLRDRVLPAIPTIFQ